MLTGEPAGALRAAAEDDGAELLVVGARGVSGRPNTLGRVANEVSHHAPCDLLIVVPPA
jgi:nucleotide-binding universal stress UspA family protein